MISSSGRKRKIKAVITVMWKTDVPSVKVTIEDFFKHQDETKPEVFDLCHPE